MGELDLRPSDQTVFLKIHQKIEQLGISGPHQPLGFSASAGSDDLRSEVFEGMLRIGEMLYSLLCRVEGAQDGTAHLPGRVPATPCSPSGQTARYVPSSVMTSAPQMRHKMMIEPETGILKEEDIPVDQDDRIIVADDRMLYGGEYREKASKQEIICADDDREPARGLNHIHDI